MSIFPSPCSPPATSCGRQPSTARMSAASRIEPAPLLPARRPMSSSSTARARTSPRSSILSRPLCCSPTSRTSIRSSSTARSTSETESSWLTSRVNADSSKTRATIWLARSRPTPTGWCPRAIESAMRAAVISSFGQPPDADEVTPPEGGSSRVLVRVSAAPINQLDLLIGSGRFYGGAPDPPYVPGVEGVGTVVEAEGLEPGTRVWFSFGRFDSPRGSMAELCAADQARTMVIEHDIDDPTAAALGLTGLAAWMSLARRASVAAGEQVLILGAAGAVGQVALQAARLLGAGRVIGASRSEDGRAIALKLGADAVVDSRGDDVDAIAARIDQACDGP